MNYDVIVVGAGPGGALAARDLARAGLSVALFDANEREKLGFTIMVESEKATFDLVGVRRPEGEEIPYHQKRMRVFSKKDKDCFTLEGEHPAMAHRLDELAQRITGEAVDAGAVFHGGHKALGPIVEDGKVVGATFKTADGEVEARAKISIDASGFAGALARELSPEMGIGFEDKKSDVVIAENYFHQIDVDQAKEAIAARRHDDEEIWNKLGAFGNFSTLYSYLSLEKQRAYVLLGRKASYGDQAPIIDVIDHFREDQGYYGDCLFGGQGPIRVRRAWDQLVADGFMVIGEAACTIIPAHGSGVSSALITANLAAKTAARVIKDGREPDTAALWPYTHEYQSGRGAILATYAAQKLLLDLIDNDMLTTMLESGAMQAEDIYNGAVPEAMGASLASIPGRLLGIIKNPGVIGTVVKMGMIIAKVKTHYENYPSAYEPAAVKSWKAKNQEIFGPLDAASK